jgi:predicted DNA-binding transcriptional regulator YafY
VNDPTARVLRLLSLLQTHRFWTGGELAERLEVSQRTLRRDIDRLRQLGYPVDATPGAAGGYRLASGAHLPPLVVDDDEAVALAIGLRAAAVASVDGIEETSVRALAKLEQVLPDRLRRRVQAVHANVVQLRWAPMDGATVDADALAVLAQGCRDHEEVRFDYQRRDGQEARRLVEPHQLVSTGRRWYLVAWDVRRRDWRTFRVDRISDARLAGGRFVPRPLPASDAAEFVARSLQALPRPHQATLVVVATAAEVAAVVPWTRLETEELDGGRTRVRLSGEAAPMLDATIAAIASVVDVESVEPEEMATRVRQLGRRLARGPNR